MAKDAAKKREPTLYVVLKQHVAEDSGPYWQEVGTTTALSRREAEKAVADGDEGVFKAVAESAWKGALKISTETQLKFEDLP